MTMKRNNGGFTLVELIVTIAIGSMITLAASTSLLLGLRINAKSTETIEAQSTTNMLVQVLESVAEAGPIEVIQPTGAETPSESVDTNWYIKTVTQNPEDAYLRYESQTIYLNNTPFMEDVATFEAKLTNNNQLLTVTITTNSDFSSEAAGPYTASVYCRLNPTPVPPDSDPSGTPTEENPA